MFFDHGGSGPRESEKGLQMIESTLVSTLPPGS